MKLTYKNKVFLFTGDAERAEEQDILNRSAALLSVIYIKYICDDENEKQELKTLYEKNEEFNHVDYNSIIASIVSDGNDVDIKKEEQKKSEVSNLPIKRESVWEKIRNFFRIIRN